MKRRAFHACLALAWATGATVHFRATIVVASFAGALALAGAKRAAVVLGLGLTLAAIAGLRIDTFDATR
jgi:uncharacterized integral membrane protein